MKRFLSCKNCQMLTGGTGAAAVLLYPSLGQWVGLALIGGAGALLVTYAAAYLHAKLST